MAALELKRQEGEMRRRPSKSRNQALELVRLTSCKQQTDEGSTSVGSCNPGHAFADGIKGQLRGRFYELEMGHALGLHGDRAARLKPKTELLELAQVGTVLLVLLGRKARAFSSAGRPLFYPCDLFRARLCRNATELGRYGARLVEVISLVCRTPPRYPDSLVSSTTCRETNGSRFGAQKGFFGHTPPGSSPPLCSQVDRTNRELGRKEYGLARIFAPRTISFSNCPIISYGGSTKKN
ncbi:hypothetical protein CsSME_00003288 [Camellia sinensis var. sinensis]